ncbi:serine/threonine-protein phosphatase 4 regulatory subunit 3B [Ditylenchus destructor]|nr:serine/threonine-protein phosphatase 4 regulatory subunit 3B [Ditylenchus destructor]
MTNSTSSAVGSSELIKANNDKGLEKAKPSAEEHPVAEDEAVKGKPALDRIDFVRDARNQVSLYELNDQGQWLIRGTGHVVCVQPQNQPDEWWIVVRHVSNEQNVLESRILQNTIYQKQNENCIIWSEPDVGKLGLSFQEKAGRTEIWDKIYQIQLEGKIRKSLEAQLRQTSENNRQLIESNRQLTADHNTLQQQLTVQLNILNAKNREILKRNCELEQELSNSQAKIRDLEAKFDQTDVGIMIAVLKENFGKLENGVAKLSSENETKNAENSQIRNKLVESEKRIADMDKKNAEMAEKLKSWDYMDQQLIRITEYAEGMRKMMPESKVEQSLQQQSPPRLDPIVPQAASKQQSQEEEVTELGPDGDSAKESLIDPQMILEEADAKNAENVASGSITDII